MARRIHLYVSVGVLAITAEAFPQLNRWLARDLNGVYVVDMSTPIPTVGPFVTGLGTTGTEDVNMMTDASNNMLFCTAVNDVNVISVFDASMNPMPNGSGLFGHASTLQSAICPRPCHPDQYFIIHLVTGVGDLYYSIVDMSLNGGLGDVTLKNIYLGTSFTEGMSISHQLSNGCRWLFTSLQNGNSHDLVRCLISQSGIGPPTMIASVSTIAPAFNFNEIELSPDNTRLAMNVYTNSSLEPDIAMWDLDQGSGTVSNLQTFSVSSDPIIGVQFSPLAGYIYFVGNGNSDNMDFGRVNVATGVPELIDPNMGRYLTQVELAGNGRIYVGLNYNHYHMAEVADPDNPTLGNIGYNHDAVYISGTGCRPPLPNAIEGEPPGSTVTPAFIEFSAYPVGACDTYQFVDSTCLSTWWEWDLGDGTVTNDQAPLHQFSPGTYDITLRVVACGDTLTLTKVAYITSTSTLAQAAMTIPTSICLGEAVAFLNGSTDATSYDWDLGDGTQSSAFEPTHTYSAPGTYPITLIAGSSCGPDTASGSIQVLDGADATFEWSSDACEPDAAFTNTSVAGTAWLWDLGDGTTDTTGSPVHTYGLPGTYTVVLIGAPGTACADTASLEITILDAPVSAFTWTTGCDLDISFIDQSTGAVQWDWDLGDGTISTDEDPTHTYAAVGDYAVDLLVTGANGCTDDSTVTLTVLPDPMAAFTVSGDPCSGEHLFTNTSAPAQTFLWSFGDGDVSLEVSPVHLFQPGAFTVILVAGAGEPCADTMSFSLVVDTLPLAAFSDSVGCDLDVHVIDGSTDAQVILWHWGDGTSSVGGTGHAYSTEGTYTLVQVATNAAGCSDTALAIIEVPSRVVAAFTGGLEPCLGDLVVANESINATALWWSFGDGQTSSASEPVHRYAEDGTYVVTLIALGDGGCSDTTSLEVDASFAGITADFHVPNVFTPNGDGVNDVFRVVGLPECVPPLLRIFNRWGELLFEENADRTWDGTYSGQTVPDGVYMYVLGGSGTEVRGHVSVLR